MPKENAKHAIRRLLAERGSVRTPEVQEATGLTRQAVQHHLRMLTASGELVREGRGRSTRYLPARRAGETLTFPVAGLEEDAVWQRLVEASPALSEVDRTTSEILHYAVTELVNNVIDHAAAQQVTVDVRRREDRLVLDIVDDGIGLFARVRTGLGLGSDLEALQEVSKGKTTTDPARHTGEGLFFTSKVVDVFEARAGRLRWVVDNQRHDVAHGEGRTVQGTRIHLELRQPPTRTLEEVFAAYTEDFEFTRTRAVVKLFAIGTRFVSRSEAKRLLNGLERFREVVLDFTGVELVGQGFVDEVFRVWSRRHPDVVLLPEGMNGAVEFMVRRAGWTR